MKIKTIKGNLKQLNALVKEIIKIVRHHNVRAIIMKKNVMSFANAKIVQINFN